MTLGGVGRRGTARWYASPPHAAPMPHASLPAAGPTRVNTVTR